jgi:hypothetical protein
MAANDINSKNLIHYCIKVAKLTGVFLIREYLELYPLHRAYINQQQT